MISAAEAKQKFPLVEEDMIQGAMWDPDAGLVTPRSQKVAADLVDEAVVEQMPKMEGRQMTMMINGKKA